MSVNQQTYECEILCREFDCAHKEIIMWDEVSEFEPCRKCGGEMFTNYSVAHKQFMRQMFGSGGHLKSIEEHQGESVNVAWNNKEEEEE